jgi:hypothetical protein
MILTDQPCVRMKERRTDLEVIQWTYASDCMVARGAALASAPVSPCRTGGWINQQQGDMIELFAGGDR